MAASPSHVGEHRGGGGGGTIATDSGCVFATEGALALGLLIPSN